MEKKLHEGLNEYDKSKSIHELVDILKVIYRVAELRGYDKESIEKLTNDKKGSFSKNILYNNTELDENNCNLCNIFKGVENPQKFKTHSECEEAGG